MSLPDVKNDLIRLPKQRYIYLTEGKNAVEMYKIRAVCLLYSRKTAQFSAEYVYFMKSMFTFTLAKTSQLSPSFVVISLNSSVSLGNSESKGSVVLPV